MKTIKEFVIGGYRYNVVGVSVIGKKKIENQDSFLIDADKTSLNVVVADGLGSAPFSKEGADHICRLCTEALRNKLNSDAILKLKEDWKLSVKSDYEKYDTTVKFLRFTDNDITFGGVGDGWICIKNNGNIDSYEQPHTFSNQTDSILSIDLISKFVSKDFEAGKEVVALISTDGFSEDIDKNNLSELLNDIENGINDDVYSFAEEMENALKNWPVETNCDDKTVVFVLRKEIA